MDSKTQCQAHLIKSRLWIPDIYTLEDYEPSPPINLNSANNSRSICSLSENMFEASCEAFPIVTETLLCHSMVQHISAYRSTGVFMLYQSTSILIVSVIFEATRLGGCDFEDSISIRDDEGRRKEV